MRPPDPPRPGVRVGYYLGRFGAATGLVHYASALATPLGRLKSVRGVLDQQARRIQRSQATPGAGQTLRSDVVAEAADARGRRLALVHLTGGDPYSFTAPVLAWAASTAAALARKLEAEGLAVVRRWKFLIVVADNEDDVRKLAGQIRREAPPDAVVRVEEPGAVGWVFMPS